MNQKSISDYYYEAIEKIRSAILRESDEQIMGSNTDELAKFHIQEYTLSSIELDTEKEPTWTYESYLKDIPAHHREHDYRDQGDLVDFQCERIVVTIPIKYNKDIRLISTLNSSTYSSSYSARAFNFQENTISFSFETKGYGIALDDDQAANAVHANINRVNDLISWKNNDINIGNANLLNQARSLIEQQKNNILLNKSKVEGLTRKINIPLKKQEPHGAQKISIDQKPIIKRIKPSPKLPENMC